MTKYPTLAALGRREFLKLIGLAGSTAVMDCDSEPAKKLIPHITAPDDIIFVYVGPGLSMIAANADRWAVIHYTRELGNRGRQICGIM